MHPKRPTAVVFVYNADSGLMNALLDSAHKLLAPQTYSCSLCALTYSAFSMHRRWKAFADALDPPAEFLHRDELAAIPGGPTGPLPAVFLRSGRRLRQIVSASEIQDCRTLDNLMALVRLALGDAPAGLPAAPAPADCPQRLDLLLDLACILDPGGSFLAAKIELAALHPEGYQHAISGPGHIDSERLSRCRLPWQALIHGLEMSGRLVSIDWQLPPADVLIQLGPLLPGGLPQDAWSWWDLDGWRSRPTFDFLVDLARRIQTPRLALGWLPLDGDAFPVFLSSPTEIEKLSALAARAGYGQIAALAPYPQTAIQTTSSSS